MSTDDPVAAKPCEIVDLGRTAYQAAYDRQLQTVTARQRGQCGDTVFLVEHPHVFTLGRRRAAEDNVLAPGDVPVVAIERGGDVTYHGPGQLVAYPVFLLRAGERDLHAFLRNLEQAIIDTVRQFGIAGGREPGKTGVWVSGRKLASIGIACRRWVTFHGLALNVTTDLGYFHRINPCGFDAAVMTSMAEQSAEHVTVDLVKPVLAAALCRSFGRAMV